MLNIVKYVTCESKNSQVCQTMGQVSQSLLPTSQVGPEGALDAQSRKTDDNESQFATETF